MKQGMVKCKEIMKIYLLIEYDRGLGETIKESFASESLANIALDKASNSYLTVFDFDVNFLEKAFQAGMDYANNSWFYNEGAEDIRGVDDILNPYPNFIEWKKQNGIA